MAFIVNVDSFWGISVPLAEESILDKNSISGKYYLLCELHSIENYIANPFGPEILLKLLIQVPWLLGQGTITYVWYFLIFLIFEIFLLTWTFLMTTRVNAWILVSIW